MERLAEQVARHRPRVVSVATPEARDALGRLIDVRGLRVVVGQEGAVEVATHADARMVVASAVGAVGLVPTYRALEAGKDVALANKETLVMAGELMVAQAPRPAAPACCRSTANTAPSTSASTAAGPRRCGASS